MKLEKLKEPLNVHQIDFRVQSINNGGYATILAYKDARVDMERLDAVVGPMNWQRLHNGHHCRVGIRDPETGEWTWKEDAGAESNMDPQKGLASDSFKRACFNWGIGRELYDYPVISVKLKDDEWTKGEGNRPNRATWKLRLREWLWYSEFDEDGRISFLAAKAPEDSQPRFKWGTRKAQ